MQMNNTSVIKTLLRCIIKTCPIHMFYYVSQRPDAHTSTYEYDNFCYQKLMRVSTNYVYNGSRAYPGSWLRIVPVLPRNPPLGKQEWDLLYAHQECNKSKGASTPHENTWRPIGKIERFQMHNILYHCNHDHKLISTSFPHPQCKLNDYYIFVMNISLWDLTRKSKQEIQVKFRSSR